MNYKIESSNDKYDDMFLKCALKGNADYLITDDMQHGLHEREYDNLKIYTSWDFVRQ
jgi:predicted nucleic acid-binding protein